MGRHVSEILLINQLLDNSPTTATSAWTDVSEFDRVTFMLNSDVTAVGASPQVTYTVEVLTGSSRRSSTTDLPTDGTARVYDKLIDKTGVDSPVASVVHTADTTAFVSISEEDAVKWVRVVATGANTDADDTVNCTVVLLGRG